MPHFHRTLGFDLILQVFGHSLIPALVLGLVLVSCLPSVARAESDVRIMVDVSGSMRWNDPNNLRVDAVRLISELMPVGHRAGVWLFAERTDRLVELGVVDAAWKNRLRQRLGNIHSRGMFTHIEDALTVGMQGWSDTPEVEQERHLVLFTDGVIDVPRNPADGERDAPEPELLGGRSYRDLIDGDYHSSIASRERILRELIPTLQRLGVKTHVIALSDEVDPELVEALASQTGGWLEVAADASALQKAFLRILDQSAPPTTVPIEGNRFRIDEGVREFTLLAFHAGVPVSLITPSGETVAAGRIITEGNMRIAWNAASDYDLVTITTPAAGEWELQGSLDPDNRVAVLTDLNLVTAPLPNTIPETANLLLDVWPTERGAPIQLGEFLELATASARFEHVSAETGLAAADAVPEVAGDIAEVTSPDSLAAIPDGPPIPAVSLVLPLNPNFLTYRAEIPGGTLKPGTYRLRILLEGATFKRQLTRGLRVTGTPLEIHYETWLPPDGDSGPARLGVRLEFDPKQIRPGSLFGYLRLEGPEGHDALLEFNALSNEAARYDLPIVRAGIYKTTARLRAETLAGGALVLEPPGEVLVFDFDDGHVPPERKGRDGVGVSWPLLAALVGGGTAAFAALLGLMLLLTRAPANPSAGKDPRQSRKPGKGGEPKPKADTTATDREDGGE